MKMTPRIDEITERFTEWLDRYTAPRGISNAPKAMQQEADALLNCFIKAAPTSGYSQWIEEKLEALSVSMKTRAWPTVGEVTGVLKTRAAGNVSANEAAVEARCVDSLAQWFAKFKSQMPGMGRDSRTRTLIQRGVLSDEREARFYGFDLSPQDSALAMKQSPGPSEISHDQRVSDKLRSWAGCPSVVRHEVGDRDWVQLGA
jgi:hypothetical protein